jgi:hypothetical protein
MIPSDIAEETKKSGITNFFVPIEVRLVRLLNTIGYETVIPVDMSQEEKERFFSDLNGYISELDKFKALTELDEEENLEDTEIFRLAINSSNPFYINHLLIVLENFWVDDNFEKMLASVAERISVLKFFYPLFGEYLFLQLFDTQLSFSFSDEKKAEINKAMTECYAEIDRILKSNSKSPMDVIGLNKSRKTGMELHFLPTQGLSSVLEEKCDGFGCH